MLFKAIKASLGLEIGITAPFQLGSLLIYHTYFIIIREAICGHLYYNNPSLFKMSSEIWHHVWY